MYHSIWRIDAERRWLVWPVTEADPASLPHVDLTRLAGALITSGTRHRGFCHPIGRHLLKPGQKNRAYEVVERKFWRVGEGNPEEYGLKTFP